MDTSLAHENARLRALLQTQQDTIRQMAEYNRLLSQRVAAYRFRNQPAEGAGCETATYAVR
ncbi:putative transposase [Escherichia coli DEC1A]|nr:putative transposase [Escherichia coli DEC1A]